MKRPIQFTLVISCYLALHVSCTNSAGNGAGKAADKERTIQIASTGSVKNSISFKINGEQVNSSGWNISRSVMSDMLVLNITSNMHQEHRTINININGDKPGTYSFLATGGYSKRGAAYGSYYPDYKEDMMRSFSFEEGTFIINSIDTTAGKVNAEFSGVVKNSEGETMTITEGKITNGELKPGVTKY